MQNKKSKIFYFHTRGANNFGEAKITKAEWNAK